MLSSPDPSLPPGHSALDHHPPALHPLSNQPTPTIPLAHLSFCSPFFPSRARPISSQSTQPSASTTPAQRPLSPPASRPPPFSHLASRSDLDAEAIYLPAQARPRGRGGCSWNVVRRAAQSSPGSIRRDRHRDPGLLWRTGLLDPAAQREVRSRLDEPGQFSSLLLAPSSELRAVSSCGRAPHP